MTQMFEFKKHEHLMHSAGYPLAPIKKWELEWKKHPEMHPFTLESLMVTMSERFSGNQAMIESAALLILHLQQLEAGMYKFPDLTGYLEEAVNETVGRLALWHSLL